MSKDETNVDEVIETEDTTVEEEATEEEQADYSDNEKRLYARLKKEREKRQALEEEAKLLREKEETLKKTLNPEEVKKEETPKTDSLSREEAILYAKGKNDDQIAHAKKVAALEGISVIEALDNPLYVAWEQKQVVDTTNQAAQLGASKSSAPHHEEGFVPGMAKEDHKELWRKATQQ